MGIPSYFRRILQKYPGCLHKRAPEGAQTIYFDFNCLIYRCLRVEGMPEWTAETNEEWEKALLQEVVKTVKEVIRESGNCKKVYLAVDGVVPMAKIRQQRVRRFKSAWMKRQGEKKESWDSNAITPGTEFMDKLTRAIDGHGWKVSGVRERGEGEHKIMSMIRERKNQEVKEGTDTKEPIVVYGLDADLILLTMLAGEECKKNIWLMREEQEFQGGPKEEKKKEQEYTFLHINEFKERLGVKGLQETINYVGIMTLMGNDFIPHSITHKLGDDGHEYVTDELYRMKRKQMEWLVNERGEIQEKVFREIAERWSKDESEKCFHMIRKKREQAGRGVLKGMEEIEGKPLQWMVERQIIDEEGQLLENWREIYNEIWLRHDIEILCKEYYEGCQWVMDYYMGKEVNKRWMFRSWAPPLWSSLAKGNYERKDKKEINTEEEPSPEEQLAMVLPLESWGLIRDREHRKLPMKAPQMWPIEFGFFSIGRKWLWESEAMIPVLSAEYLREILKEQE